MGNGNFERYAQEDERIKQEVEIANKLLELQGYIRSRYNNKPGGNPRSLEMGPLNPWVKTIAGHADRIAWLNQFTAEAKRRMEEILPEGIGFDALDSKNLRDLIKPEDSEVLGQISRLSLKIREDFDQKDLEWMREDGEI